MTAIRKAVFPAAGLGTRFLPATKAQPKEMLPIVDKPIIQYGVEEAVAAGIDQIIVVTGRDKRAIVDHFDISFELEHYLKDRGKTRELQLVRKISDLVDITYIHQKEPLGLGHAVLMAKDVVGNEPFAVFLADDIIRSHTPAIKQMMDVFGPRQRLPALGEKVLRHHLLRGQLKDGDAPLVQGVRHLDLEVALGIQIPNDPVLVGSASP